jgi:hypothetical protein
MDSTRMTLVEAAEVVERLQLACALESERRALGIARDAMLTLVSEGFTTLEERLEQRSAAGRMRREEPRQG